MQSVQTYIMSRVNTVISDSQSQFQPSFNLPTIKQQQQHQTNRLLSKALKSLNTNRELASFTKRILLPKRVKNQFLQAQQRKRMKQKATKPTRFLIGELNPIIKSQRKRSEQHGMYDQSYKNSNQQTRYKSIQAKPRRETQLKSMNAKSLSKIQMLTNREKQQPIEQNKYENENYIFLNMKQLGESQQVSNYDLKSQKSEHSDSKQVYNFRKQSIYSISNRSIRRKVKSYTKYDRQRPGLGAIMYPKEGIECKQKVHKKHKQGFSRTQHNIDIGQFDLIKLIAIKQPKNQLKQVKKKSIPMMSGFKSLLGLVNMQNSSRNSQFLCPSLSDQDKFNQQLQIITKKYLQNNKQEERLYLLLAGISKDMNKDTMRIYKDDFQKIYVHRYGRDKITSFFDYQYIQDYDSLYKLFTESVLTFKKQQVLLLSFMMLDFDNDGLISHSDLFKTLTLMDKNNLVRTSVFTILKHIKQKSQIQAINDTCTEDYLKKQSLTFKKYRFMMYMREKNKIQEQSGILSLGKLSLMKQSEKDHKVTSNRIGPLHKHLFSLRQDTTIESKEFYLLQSFLEIFNKNNQPLINNLSSFSMNFERFKSLHKSQVPEIYYDILYSAFGYKDPNLQYDQIDYHTPLIKVRKMACMEQTSKHELLVQNIGQMRHTRADLNSKLVSPDFKRSRKIRFTLG